MAAHGQAAHGPLILHNAVLSEMLPRLSPRICFVLNTVAKGFNSHADFLKIRQMPPHFVDIAMDDIDACVLSGSVTRLLTAEAMGFVPHGPLAMHLAAFTRNKDMRHALRGMRVPAPIDSRVIDVFAAQADKKRLEWAMLEGAPRDDMSLHAVARSGDLACVQFLMSKGYRVSPGVVDYSILSGNGRIVEDLVLYEGAQYNTDSTLLCMGNKRHDLVMMLNDFDRGNGRIDDSRIIGLGMHIATHEPHVWSLLDLGGVIRVFDHAPELVDPPGFDTEDYDTSVAISSDDSDDDWD